jgi:hypothetical protein
MVQFNGSAVLPNSHIELQFLDLYLEISKHPRCNRIAVKALFCCVGIIFEP